MKITKKSLLAAISKIETELDQLKRYPPSKVSHQICWKYHNEKVSSFKLIHKVLKERFKNDYN